MFWVFKKKWHEEQINKKLLPLQGTLRESFSKIKEDFLKIHNKHDEHYSELNEKILHLIKRVERLEGFSIQEPSINNPIIKPKIILTEAQKNLFEGIVTIQYLSKGPWITFKSIANQLHPGRKYSEIRSTLSEYINILEELGLIKKNRQGKRVYISLTKKGLELIDEEKLKKRLLKLIEI